MRVDEEAFRKLSTESVVFYENILDLTQFDITQIVHHKQYNKQIHSQPKYCEF